MSANVLEPDDDQTGHSQVEAARAVISQLLLLLLTAATMLQLFPMLPLSTRLMLLALVLLSLRLWGGLMLLVAGLLDLLLRDLRIPGQFAVAEAVTWTFLLATVAMCGFRQRRALQQLSGRSLRSVLRDVFGVAAAPAEHMQHADEALDMLPATLADRLLESAVYAIRGLLSLLSCTVVAAVLLEWMPRGGRLSRAVREAAAADPELAGMAFLATAVVAVLLLAGELSWRQLTPSQARLYLRSLRLQFFFADLSLLARGRMKERLRRVRERVETEG
ncbi:MAG: hypothetical protein ACKO2P_21545 [Planctomycetota bacterium]